MGLFLGLDSSTQSLSAIVIDTDTGAVVRSESVVYGQDLPQYGAPNGVLPHDDPSRKHGDPLLWTEALDVLCGRLRASGLKLAAIRGISGAGQQHGSVYLGRSVTSVGGWDPKKSLKEQVAPLLSRSTAPIWMDSSTSRQCEEIAAALGGSARVVSISGSRAIERFTGPQIRKFHQDSPAAYERTREIHLVSSFVASLLTGTSAPIDFGDGAGMNLLDLAAGTWSAALLDATAPDLGSRLLPPVPSHTQVGELAAYFVARYGFAKGTPVFAFTGDNPSSLIGMGASRPGVLVVSLGTSDTVFAAMPEPRTDPGGFGHVFGNPAGGFMSLICFANGSLAREAVAQKVGLDWEGFAQAILRGTRPGNDGNWLLPYFVPEMTPRILKPDVRLFGSPAFTSWQDADAAARAIVEAQAITMKRHSEWIGVRPDTLLATGGAAKNSGILQVLADTFGAEVLPLRVANSSALGGALRAAQAVEHRSWDALAADFSAPDPTLARQPDPAARSAMDRLSEQFAKEIAKISA